MTKEEKARELLKKYLKNELDASALQQVEDWYTTYEERKIAIDVDKKELMKQQMFIELQKKIHTEVKPAVFHLSVYSQWLKIAAVLLITPALALAIYAVFYPHKQKEMSYAITTTASEKKKIILTDGSEILLGPSSKFIYPAKFNKSLREVELEEGEAFFKIAHEEQRSFIVKTTDDLQTKVLGTSFTIRSFRAKRSIDIMVATGKVSVGNTHQVFGTLVKGQQISYDRKHHRAEISYSPETMHTAIVFERTTLQAALHQLEYIYSIKIALSPSLYQLKCAASFNSKQKPAEILSILCSLHHLKFSSSEDQKTFKVYKMKK